jgi:hypothetical protein
MTGNKTAPPSRARLNVVRLLKYKRAALERQFARDADLGSLLPAIFRIVCNGDADYIDPHNPTKVEDVRWFILDAMDARIEQAWLDYQLAARRETEPSLDRDMDELKGDRSTSK